MQADRQRHRKGVHCQRDRNQQYFDERHSIISLHLFGLEYTFEIALAKSFLSIRRFDRAKETSGAL
jgi:hypothetical protein